MPLQTVAATTPATTPAEEDAAASDSADDTSSDASSDEPEAPAKDSSAELNKLKGLSAEEYQKAAQKLPDEVGTGGKAPPKDNKPAGGGSEFEEFN